MSTRAQELSINTKKLTTLVRTAMSKCCESIEKAAAGFEDADRGVEDAAKDAIQGIKDLERRFNETIDWLNEEI